MIAVRKYKAFWDYIGSNVNGISRVFVVDDEPELANIIAEIDDREVFLVAVYPSSDMVAIDEDNHGDVDTCVFYVLMKVDRGNENQDDVMNERETTQNILTAIRARMLELEESCDRSDASILMNQMIRGKQHIDRERNYLGCNGYSMSLSIKTNGF